MAMATPSKKELKEGLQKEVSKAIKSMPYATKVESKDMDRFLLEHMVMLVEVLIRKVSIPTVMDEGIEATLSATLMLEMSRVRLRTGSTDHDLLLDIAKECMAETAADCVL